MAEAILHDGTEWTEARGFDMLRTLTPPTDPTTGSAAHYGPAQAESRRSEVEHLSQRSGFSLERAVWVALTDEVAVRGTLSTIGEAAAFVAAFGLHRNAFGFREASNVGHEHGQRYVDTGVCGCLVCVLFPLTPDEVEADEAIDREATIAHVGIDQPDWTEEEARLAAIQPHLFVLDVACVGTVCAACEDEQPSDRPCPASPLGQHRWVEVKPCWDCGLTLHAELPPDGRKAHVESDFDSLSTHAFVTSPWQDDDDDACRDCGLTLHAGAHL